MPSFRFIPSGLLSRVTLAVAGTVLALAAISFTAVRATRSATTGADRVESEFAERVDTAEALEAATDNLALAEERLAQPPGPERDELRAELSSSDGRLARLIGGIIAGSRVEDAERQVAARIEVTYGVYVRARDLALEAPRDQGSRRLRVSFEPLETALQKYGDIHFAEATRSLEELRRGGTARNVLLAVVLVLGLLSLVAITLLARGIVARVRVYGAFAHQVALGDLTARLRPSGRDELARLGESLDEMVEQLAGAQRSRDELHRSELAYREVQDGFAALLQVTENEQEAHRVLKVHLERCVPGAAVVVLSRDAEHDRLYAATDPVRPPLGDRLTAADARSCLAVRLGAPRDSGGDAAALLECPLCRGLEGHQTCVPLLVSGEVLGAVLVSHPAPLDPLQARHVHDSAGQAAPILANLRNLALAEHRAATDALTGLPNRRAVQDTLRRFMALSSRRQTPVAAITLDLDHFKTINDTLGHDRGDAALAAVGATLAASVRQSDFVGRVGGEEFIVLLPDSDTAAAAEVAEKLRAAVATLTLDGMDRPLTASFGVAAHPDAAADADTLLRVADRALYAAKAAGRNRVVIAPPAGELADDAEPARRGPRFPRRS